MKWSSSKRKLHPLLQKERLQQRKKEMLWLLQSWQQKYRCKIKVVLPEKPAVDNNKTPETPATPSTPETPATETPATPSIPETETPATGNRSSENSSGKGSSDKSSWSWICTVSGGSFWRRLRCGKLQRCGRWCGYHRGYDQSYRWRKHCEMGADRA